MDVSLDNGSPKEHSSSPPRNKDKQPANFSTSLVDPALHRHTSPGPPSDSGHEPVASTNSGRRSGSSTPHAEAASRAVAAATEAADRAEEQWIEHVRLIENLRKYIGERLSRGEYEGEEEQQSRLAGMEEVAREAEAAEGKMEGVETADEKKTPSKSLYPLLQAVDGDDGDTKMNVDTEAAT
jgi:hypothetical protein